MLPPVWAKANQVDTNYPETMPNLPFRLDTPPLNKALDVATRDLVHRFYQNQEQINGGRNDRFAAMSDAGGLVMGITMVPRCSYGISPNNTRLPITSSWGLSAVRF